MALSADVNLTRRGQRNPGDFGYPVAPGETIYLGSLVGLNASGQVQRAQTAGTDVILGVSDKNLNNFGNASASAVNVVAQRGIWGGMAITGAAFNKIGAPVYAVDDNTLNVTNTGGTLLVAGTISGYDVTNSTYYVEINGSL